MIQSGQLFYIFSVDSFQKSTILLTCRSFSNGLYHHLLFALRANINFASGAAKTIAARSRNIEIRKLKITVWAGVYFLLFRRKHYTKDLPNEVFRK